jgi:hypothetical protein
MSGGAHCKVVATCTKTGQTQIFQIGGPANATNWQKLWSGLIPPKADSYSGQLAQSNETDYAATCSGDNCDCKALQCLQKTFADAIPPPYYALWQNSNTFAHSLLSQCSWALAPTSRDTFKLTRCTARCLKEP